MILDIDALERSLDKAPSRSALAAYARLLIDEVRRLRTERATPTKIGECTPGTRIRFPHAPSPRVRQTVYTVTPGGGLTYDLRGKPNAAYASPEDVVEVVR